MKKSSFLIFFLCFLGLSTTLQAQEVIKKGFSCHNISHLVGKLKDRENKLPKTDRLIAKQQRASLEDLYGSSPHSVHLMYQNFLRSPQNDLNDKDNIMEALRKSYHYSDEKYQELYQNYEENPPYIYCPLRLNANEITNNPVDVILLIGASKMLNPDYMIYENKNDPLNFDIKNRTRLYKYVVKDKKYHLYWNDDSVLYNDITLTQAQLDEIDEDLDQDVSQNSIDKDEETQSEPQTEQTPKITDEEVIDNIFSNNEKPRLKERLGKRQLQINPENF